MVVRRFRTQLFALGFSVAGFCFSVAAPATSNRIFQQEYSTIPNFDCYYDVEGTMEWIEDLVGSYASSEILDVRLVDIGDSWVKTKASDPANQEMIETVTDGLYTEGFDIHALTITRKPSSSSNNVNESVNNNANEKAPFLMVSSTHAREYTPPQMIRKWLAEELLPNVDNNDPDTLSWLEHTELHWIPFLNPDGRVVAETRQIWRRKNLNIEWKNSDNCSPSGFGVDLNRNFPFEWGDNTGSSSNACKQVARGTEPASEPETIALVEYAESVFPAFQRLQNALVAGGGDYHPTHDVPSKSVVGSSTKWKGFDPMTTQGCFVDVHSYGEIYVYPWGNQQAMTPNDVSFRAVMGNLQHFTGYEATRPGPQGIYVASGATEDWAYGVLGALGMTWELGSSFHEPCLDFQGDYQKHFRSLEYLAKIAPFPFALGKGPLIEDITMSSSSVVLYYTITNDGTAEFVAGDDGDDFLSIDIRASLPSVLPAFEDPIQFDDGDTSYEPLGTSIPSIRIYYQSTNPLLGLVDLRDMDDNEFYWNLAPESPQENVYTVSIGKTQMWQAFGPDNNGGNTEHALYFQATDNAGNKGPLTTVRLEVFPTLSTESPTKQPTASPTLLRTESPTGSPTPQPTPQPTTASPSSLPSKSTPPESPAVDCAAYNGKGNRKNCNNANGCFWKRKKKLCKPCEGIKKRRQCKKKKKKCAWNKMCVSA